MFAKVRRPTDSLPTPVPRAHFPDVVAAIAAEATDGGAAEEKGAAPSGTTAAALTPPPPPEISAAAASTYAIKNTNDMSVRRPGFAPLGGGGDQSEDVDDRGRFAEAVARHVGVRCDGKGCQANVLQRDVTRGRRDSDGHVIAGPRFHRWGSDVDLCFEAFTASALTDGERRRFVRVDDPIRPEDRRGGGRDEAEDSDDDGGGGGGGGGGGIDSGGGEGDGLHEGLVTDAGAALLARELGWGLEALDLENHTAVGDSGILEVAYEP
jgi:hypothetical protein